MFVPEWLLAVVVTLFVLDIFIPTEVSSWLGIVCFASYVTWRLSPSPLWGILTFIVTFCLTVVLYYYLLRKLIRRCSELTIMRHQQPDILERLAGQTGEIHIVDGKKLVNLNNELWNLAVSSSETYQEGDKVSVVSLQEGSLNVKKLQA